MHTHRSLQRTVYCLFPEMGLTKSAPTSVGIVRADDKPHPSKHTVLTGVCVCVSVYREGVGIVRADEKPLPSPSTPSSLVRVCVVRLWALCVLMTSHFPLLAHCPH